MTAHHILGSWPRAGRWRALAVVALLVAAGACDCNGTKLNQASTGVTLVDPPGTPDQIERTIDFGTVTVETLHTHEIVLRNDGTVSARITKVQLITHNTDVYLTNTNPLPLLQTKETFTMEVRWLPAAVETLSGQVVIETDSPSTPKYLIDLKGKAATTKIDVCSTDQNGKEICVSTAPGGHLVVPLGSARPGTTAQKPLVIKDLGDATLTVTRVAPTSATTTEITTVAAAGVNPRSDGSFDVAAQKSATYDVNFKPIIGGPVDGFIEILSDDPNQPQILVEVTAMGDAAHLCVVPSSLSLDFGDVNVGTTAHAPAPGIELSSCGTEPVTIYKLALLNPDNAPDVFGMSGTPSLPATLNPGDKIDLDMTYSPTAMEDDDGQLNIWIHDPTAANASLKQDGWVTLHGRGVECLLQAVPNPVDFGDVPVAAGSTAVRTVSVRAVGSGECQITDARMPNAPFAVVKAPTLPLTLPPGQTTTYQVSFTPTSTGQATDKLSLVDSAGTLDIDLIGNGAQAPPCDLVAQPPSVTFANASTGSSTTQNVIVKNIGSSDCDIRQGGMTASSSPDFTATIPGGIGASVPAGGTMTVPVTFKPTTSGTATGTLEIVYDDPNTCSGFNCGPCMGPPLPCTGPKLDVPIQGGTLAPAICIYPTELDWSSVAPGNSAPRSFTITSCGAGALALNGITLAAGSSRAFEVTQMVQGTGPTALTLPTYLDAGKTATVTVTYSPTTNGGDFGRVTVLNGDPSNPSAAVKLVGNASNVCDTELSCNETKLSFPVMEEGRTAAMSLVCYNAGSQPATITSATFASGTSGEFSVTAGRLPVTVPPGGTIRLTVSYTPQDVGSDSGELDIQGACDPVAIALDGAGKAPDYPACEPPRVFNPQVKWSWNGQGALQPGSNNVEMGPIVVNLEDTNGDGKIDENDIPDVVFATCSGQTCCINCMNISGGSFAQTDFAGKAMLRAVSGKSGQTLWTAVDPTGKPYDLTAETQIAAADLDGDNLPDIIAVGYSFHPGTGNNGMDGKYASGHLLVFDHTGKLEFQTDLWTGDPNDGELGSGPTIADLDGTGSPVIMFERTLFNSDGTKRFDVKYSGDDGHDGFPIITPIDDSGKASILYGGYAYNADGSLKWQAKGVTGAMDMVLDVDGDGKPEVVMRTAPDTFEVVDGATGQLKYGPFTWTIPDSICSAPMAAADVNGDGKPEIIIPSGDFVHVFNPVTGQELWKAPVHDYGDQCGASGSAAFDFQGDGHYDVVYHDTDHMYVFNGRNGQTLYEADRSSSTLLETPVIADVDNDGHADLVMTNENGVSPIPTGISGIQVLSNEGNDWPATRRIWNEHEYHQSNVNENDTVPRVELPSWKTNNNWRAQPPLCKKTAQ